MTARDRRIIAIIGTLVVIVAGWMLVIQPKRSQASNLGGQLSSEQAQLAQARTEVASDDAAYGQFTSDYTEVARLGEAVPSDDDVPSLLVQLQHAAKAARVNFQALNLQPGTSTPTPAPAASHSSMSGTSSTTASSGTSSATASSSVTSGSTLPPGVAVGSAGFPAENFSFEFEGTFFHLSDFLRRVEAFVTLHDDRVSVDGRLLTLNAVQFAPSSTDSASSSSKSSSTMQVTISATDYLEPAAQGLFNGATASGPSSSSAPTSGSGSGSTTATATGTPVSNSVK